MKTKMDCDWGDKTMIIRHGVLEGLLMFLVIYLGGEFSKYKLGFLQFLFFPQTQQYC